MSDLVTVEGDDSKLTQMWIDRINKVLLMHYQRGYKRTWCAYRFGDCVIEPPLVAWEYLAKKLGYEVAWAHDKFAQWKPRGGNRIGYSKQLKSPNINQPKTNDRR